MNDNRLRNAITLLQNEFQNLNFASQNNSCNELIYNWPGPENEDIIICVHQSNGIQEPFHRHDFFYFNYTYKGHYESLSHKYDCKIEIKENELYAGQPYAGHALCVHDNEDTVILGILIKRETFLRYFLPMLSTGSKLFHFFINPITSQFSEEFIHFELAENDYVKTLLEMMLIEYADKKEDTQQILKPLALAFLMQITRQYASLQIKDNLETLSEQIIGYMSEHLDAVTLKDIAAHFSYHPNYISSVIHKEQGKTFSQLLLEQRMSRADILLKSTDLSIEEIAGILGYSNSSNFYKFFKSYYHCSPAEYRIK